MNLSDRLRDLVRLLFDVHKSTNGAEFNLTRSVGGFGLSYPAIGCSLLPYSDFDFKELRGKGLISFSPVSRNVWRGRMTDTGIAMAQRSFHVRRLMRDYEQKSLLLSDAARAALQTNGELFEIRLSEALERGSIAIRTASPSAVVLELREQIRQAAAAVAANGIKEFGRGVVASQYNRQVDATFLRSYTAILVARLRKQIYSAPILSSETPSWSEDLVVKTAIEACEDIVAEQEKSQNQSSDHTAERPAENRPWSDAVLEWEAYKATAGIETSGVEMIPEVELRRIAALKFGIEPGKLTDDEIELVVNDLCIHYELIRIVPNGARSPNRSVSPDLPVAPIEDSVFWGKCETEFRTHDRGPNQSLIAVWNSVDKDWSFSVEPSSSPASVEDFKSLAREAAQGLGYSGLNAWGVWLDTLRAATDEQTGKLLYARVSNGASTESVDRREGFSIPDAATPPDALVEFARADDGSVDKRFWTATQRVVVEALFSNSARLCMKFRSLAPNPETAKVPTDQTTLTDAAAIRGIAIRPPSLFEIAKHADGIFMAGIEERTRSYAEQQASTLAGAAATNNSGAYLPTLIKCKQERLRAEILLLADAWVEAGETYGVALGDSAYEALEKSAMQMAAGINSAIRGELDLHATRTRTPRSGSGGEREIHRTKNSALRLAKIKLNTQRIKTEREPRNLPPSKLQGKFNLSKHDKPRLLTRIATESVSEKAQRRKAVLDPILRKKVMTVNQWADAASASGLSHSTVFRYYNGESNPRITTLAALANPLGLKAEALPH